jgi:hypothetical protein
MIWVDSTARRATKQIKNRENTFDEKRLGYMEKSDNILEKTNSAPFPPGGWQG